MSHDPIYSYVKRLAKPNLLGWLQSQSKTVRRTPACRVPRIIVKPMTSRLDSAALTWFCEPPGKAVLKWSHRAVSFRFPTLFDTTFSVCSFQCCILDVYYYNEVMLSDKPFFSNIYITNISRLR
jgi:hypothetical protein